jgi:hypothetical protein
MTELDPFAPFARIMREALANDLASHPFVQNLPLDQRTRASVMLKEDAAKGCLRPIDEFMTGLEGAASDVTVLDALMASEGYKPEATIRARSFKTLDEAIAAASAEGEFAAQVAAPAGNAADVLGMLFGALPISGLNSLPGLSVSTTETVEPTEAQFHVDDLDAARRLARRHKKAARQLEALRDKSLPLTIRVGGQEIDFDAKESLREDVELELESIMLSTQHDLNALGVSTTINVNVDIEAFNPLVMFAGGEPGFMENPCAGLDIPGFRRHPGVAL